MEKAMKPMNRLSCKIALAAMGFVVAACSIQAAPTSTPAATPNAPVTTAPTDTPAALATVAVTSPPASTPTATIVPSQTPNPFPDPALSIAGKEQLVFQWSKDKCEDLDIPDLPARAFRDAQGNVQLIASHLTARRAIGPDLDHVKHECQPVMHSDLNPDPSKYDDSEWLASPYSLDGETVYALVHNEYHGHEHPGMCPQHDYFPCWDNSITLAVSKDAGASYTEALTPPANLVARLPYQYKAGAGPDGTRAPSNIIKGPGDYYYSFFNVSMVNTQEQWVCLMRTNDLADPTSWRYWDGQGFDGQFIDPYLSPDAPPADHLCPALARNQIGASMNDSITFNTFLNRYVLVGISADQIDNRETWGFFYAFSDDLVHWTHRKLLLEVPLPWTVQNSGTDVYYLYPSLLDPQSDSRNFETTGDTAYLYFTRFNNGQGGGPLDRDLIRVPVQFFGSQAQAPQGPGPFQP
jgi:hypothetical protein